MKAGKTVHTLQRQMTGGQEKPEEQRREATKRSRGQEASQSLPEEPGPRALEYLKRKKKKKKRVNREGEE